MSIPIYAAHERATSDLDYEKHDLIFEIIADSLIRILGIKK